MEGLRVFENRVDAGRELAAALKDYAGKPDVIVLGLARGGVPVAAEVARALNCPLDVWVVRKVGTPGQPELAMGAVSSGGALKLNTELLERLDITEQELELAVARERRELERRERLYRDGRPAPNLKGLTAILVDDGLATGTSMRAAIASVREQGAAKIVVAVPVGSPDTCRAIAREADDVICVLKPRSLNAVSQWYADFSQTSDHEVQQLLATH
jgi:putative phosphoribosyl transferase